MKREELKDILQNGYTQEKWIKTLQFLSGNKNLLTVLLEPKIVDIKSVKANEIVSKIVQLGSLKTTDGIILPIFDVTLHDAIRIEYNRVGVNDLLKNHILKDALKGAIITFHYSNDYNKPEWRFSFISKFGSDYFAEAVSIETNPKKYTYIFGTKEEHRTALERLYNLEQSRFKLEDFFEAFNVEPVSINFFREYHEFYLEFVSEINNNKTSRAVFEKNNISKNDVEKDIRNFVKRLLGRLVFLYFLQKKHWLGATNKEYDDGDFNFLLNLFNFNNESKENFYNKWLSKLFFNALNTPNRENDNFELPNGKCVWIPFLNGGLFEEFQEPDGHRQIKFPPTLFELLFKFFNGYNFTIYENSPEDHTVAVDPEMLGHIFENLLEDNKDKGAFYTPKEIVHYMTQESLIDYLKTHVSQTRVDIESLIKKHLVHNFSHDDLKNIEFLIDKVKICDPAIGSGAFPMGLLQNIFSLKALIHYELERDLNDWKPAEVKQNIIQNSIYGVDIESDAVDIARLRFWLSLVVDEQKPKPLPNLDFKIVQGNSLLSRFKIEDSIENVFKDLNKKRKKNKQDALDLGQYKNLMNQYLNATDADSKRQYKELISEIKSAFVFSLNNKEKFEISKARGQFENLLGNNLFGENIGDTNELNQAKKKLLKLEKGRTEKEEGVLHSDSFEWRFEFPNVLNEEGDYEGFDIVIGNPPYVDIKKLPKEVVLLLFKKYATAENRINLYSIFIELGLKLNNKNGILTYIIPNSLLLNSSYSKIRNLLIDDIQKVIKLPDRIFVKAIVETIIFQSKKNNASEHIEGAYYKNDELIDFNNLNFVNYDRQSWKKNSSKFNVFVSSEFDLILNSIEENNIQLATICDFSLGITPYDSYKGHSQQLIKNREFHSETKKSEEYVPLISGKNILRYIVDSKIEEYLKYGQWLGAPRQKRFFTEPRVIVRQIISGVPPKIYAGFTKTELYLTQIGFVIIPKDEEKITAKSLTAILNSQILNFYHKYKFTDIEKKTFQKILIENCKKFPIPKLSNDIIVLLENLVDILIFMNENKNIIISDIVKNEHIVNFFEEVIDGCVFELYFSDHMNDNNIEIINDVKNYLNQIEITQNFEYFAEQDKVNKVWELYTILKESDVQQKMIMFVVKSPNILKPILQN